MTTQYTPILKLALPVTGELSGTWGDVVNDNITSMVEQAIAGLATISTWTANSHTLTTANGTTSESRCAMLVAQNGAGLAAAGEIVCPASSKLYVLKNDTSYAITLKTAAGTGVAVASGNTAFLFCDGTNVNACVTTIVDGRVTGNLTVDGNATVNGNTTLGNATSDTITATARFASGLTPSADNTYDLGSTANSWKDLYIDGTATMALVAISGGTINGVSIGATTPATFLAVDNLSLDGNTIASTNTNGNIVIAPNGTGDVQLDADTVRVGDAGAAVTLTSNGAGALTVTTGGAADLTLSTNSGATTGTIVIANGANGNITLTPDGTGDVILSADRVQIGDANTDTTLTTNGTGSLNLTTNNGTNSGTIQIAQGANGNITLTPNGTGSVSVPKLVWSNGTSGRVPYLTTGGLFTDSANLTFNGTTLTANTLSLTTPLAVASGGTNGTAVPTAGAVAYGTGTAYAFTAAGSSGQVLTSAGAGAPVWTTASSVAVTTFSAGTTGFTPSSATSGAITLAGTLNVTNGGTGLTSLTAGYIPFGTGTSAFGTSANLFWDSATSRLGLGTTTPSRRLEVAAGTGGPALRLTNTNSNSGIEILTAPTTYSWLLGAQYNLGSAFEITPSTAVGGTTFTTPTAVFLQNGNVGIGTIGPGRKLSVSNAGAQGIEFGPGVGGGSGNEILNYNRVSSQYVPCQTYASTHAFYSGTAGGSLGLFQDGSGAVGIATLSPSNTLSVSGTVGAGASALSDAIYQRNQAVSGTYFTILHSGTGLTGTYPDTVTDATKGAHITMSSGDLTNDYAGVVMINAYGKVGSTLGNYIYFGRRTGVDTISESARFDSSGRLLIGTTTSRNLLTVQGTVFSTPTLGTASGQGFFGEAAGYGMMLGTSGFGYGWIQQQRVDGSATAYALILQPVGGSVYVNRTNAQNNGKLEVLADSGGQAIVAQVQSNGNSLFQGFSSSGGSAVFQVTGNGALGTNTVDLYQGALTFPATQVPSANANTLDDYEQGSWTPAITADTGPSSVTYYGRDGNYTKIGNVVYFNAWIAVGGTFSGASGNLYITGLPFTSAAGSVYAPTVSAWISSTNYGAGYTITPIVIYNSTTIWMTRSISGSGYSFIPASAIVTGSPGSEWRITGFYYASN